jgi:nitrite reductase (NO-forming)
MKKFSIFLKFLFIGFVFIMFSCSSGGGNQTSESSAATGQEEAAHAADDEAAMMARGEEIYNANCIACHQANGKGLDGAFPSLVGSEFLLETPVMAAAQVLNGSEAVPSHGDVEYPVPMPAQLDNKEGAVAVINYVLKSYNNSDTRITVEDLADIIINPR